MERRFPLSRQTQDGYCTTEDEKMVNRVPTLADEFVSLREAMDRFFGEPSSAFRGNWGGLFGNGTGRMPLPLDVYATPDEVVMIAAVPGIRPDDIEISINQNTVMLSGKLPNVAASEEGKQATWYLHELSHGAFQRSVTLPIEVDANRADATFENGILRLRLPKAEAAKPRQIKVRAGAEGGSEAIEAETGGSSRS
jgi:HSP20 family protein